MQAALWYADLGYAVLPCAPGRKTPLTDHGLLDATSDAGTLERWWSGHPDANIAIRTDGLVAIDVDGPQNPWLAEDPDRQRDLAAAPTSLTPRGGRQYLFRQPVGRAWRNTAGRLAPDVDTRADGGYILVMPSIVDGRPYRWSDGELLHIAPEHLPEPPPWLFELLDAIATEPTHDTVTPADPIPAGQRNQTLARLAGAMRRVGMSQTEIHAALLRVNVERCTPPLEVHEVERVAASIARYPPDAISVALVEDHFAQDFAPAPDPQPTPVGDLLQQHPLLRAPVIVGLLRRGETMNVIAPPKAGKSWLVLSLAMAVATGRPWLDTFETVAGRVLILDNELHAETLAHRIPQVAAALNVGLDEIRDRVDVQSLRGRLRDILSLRSYFDTLEPGRYTLVILDAMYRFMPVGSDENDNGTMAGIYNRIDAFADRLGCCFALVHHSTKGNQSQKAVTDVGAGAGSQSRATDTHLVLRAHEEPGAAVLDAAVRSWPAIEPLTLRWTFPVWKLAPELDPAALRSEKPKRRTTRADDDLPPDDQVHEFVRRFLSERPKTRSAILREATTAGLSGRQAQRLLRWAADMELAFHWGGGRYHPSRYASVPRPDKEDPDAHMEARSYNA